MITSGEALLLAMFCLAFGFALGVFVALSYSSEESRYK